MSQKMLIALAGQPNAGKSTIFNVLTGARQHVANYPGVTVEKKVGYFSHKGISAEIVDLPGTYSLTSYSMEERVARDFILKDNPSLVINVVDASNLRRHLFLSFQLLEMGAPVIMSLNMMDVSESRNQVIDVGKLEETLGIPVIPTIGRKGVGKKELRQALGKEYDQAGARLRIDYGPLEPHIDSLENEIKGKVDSAAPPRWLAIKLLEGDTGIRDFMASIHPEAKRLLQTADSFMASFKEAENITADQFIEQRRYTLASSIAESCVEAPEEGAITRSDKVDRIICHRFLGYPILFGAMYLMYYLSIEWGYELTNYTWPILAGAREFVAGLLPAEGFITDPMLRSLILWVADSITALLNYVPIFLILFAYISFLEDLGYMPRMAFMLDSFFRRFGLHGQSTLPLVLGGVYVGGCAVPGVMACRAVPDEKARLATILVVPMMNCLAKVPLYVLLIGAYFSAYKGHAMFFMATITVILALTMAKILSLTVLKAKETAPFIMEMPPYHAPTFTGVLRRAIERVWIYIKKITTVVAAVAVMLFVLMQFPGVSTELQQDLEQRTQDAQATFVEAAAQVDYYAEIDTPEEIDALFDFANRYKTSRLGVSDADVAAAIDQRFQEENELFFHVVKPPKDNPEAKKIGREFKKLRRARLAIRKEHKDAVINNSFLGMLGHWLEPVTQYAGFNWRVNVALLSALAAKENTVATLGALYQPEESVEEEQVETTAEGVAVPAQSGVEALESRMVDQEAGFTPLHALALMLFMALYPPCMATTMVVKVQAGSWKWMFFSLAYMMGLGAFVAALVFSVGKAVGIDGVEAMAWFYGLALLALLITGLIKPKPTDT